MSADQSSSPKSGGQGDGRYLELAIVVSFVVTILAAAGFAALYVTGNETQLAGICVFAALGGLALGLGLWARWFMPGGEQVEERPPLPSDEAERQVFVADLQRGERSFTRRRLLGRLLGAGVVASGLAALFPFKSLGPNPGKALSRTAWRPGRRLVDEQGKPVRTSDLTVGSAVTVYPEGHQSPGDSQTLLIKYGGAPLHLKAGRQDWVEGGCIAYSKVCTHAGCPVGLYQAQTHQLMCPCHQSLFDVLDGAKPVFGPATRSLPQLPLASDAEGYLVARRDYTEPIGPGYWHRQ